MPIVFSAITPHPPLLIPAVGRENLEQVKNTAAALESLGRDLLASKAETAVIISPHGHTHAKTFLLNLSPDFQANFQAFGDFATKLSFRGDVIAAHKIKEDLEKTMPIQMITNKELDHGASVPLFYLAKNNPDLRIIPLSYSGLGLAEHFVFGENLRRAIERMGAKKIALIASGDLSHSLTPDAPAGYSPRAKKFDNKLIELLAQKKNRQVLKISPALIAEANECGLRSIAILLGALEGMEQEAEVLSYEFPFGVGYLTMKFKL